MHDLKIIPSTHFVSTDIRKYIFAFILFADILSLIQMTTARQKILDYLQEQQSATVEELSKVFQVTPANIRHHLSILTGQGSVKVIGSKAAPAKGRPSQIYSSTLCCDRNNLDQLSEILVSFFIDNCQAEETDVILKKVANRLISKFSIEKVNPTRRLYAAIHTLNRLNYQAHWEAHVENPRIMLGHCPYNSLQDHHPSICQLDKHLLESLLDTPVELAEKQVLNDKNLPECVFLINKKTS